MPRTEPAFTRLDVDERRRLLLEMGRSLFTKQPYDELSMAAIAREAGISKALLYHYFPSKQAFFVATLEDAAQELAARVRPSEDQPPRAQLESALAEWLDWVDENRDTYGRLLVAAGGIPEVRQLIEMVRGATAALIMERLEGPATPELRAAVMGRLWLMDGVCLEWVQSNGSLGRDKVQALLADGLVGVIRAAGHADVAERVA
jgi:AcrR family transcriptional regulator